MGRALSMHMQFVGSAPDGGGGEVIDRRRGREVPSGLPTKAPSGGKNDQSQHYTTT